MEALGSPACIPRWVAVLHGGTCATVAYNGWVTAPFPVRSGVFQGSPLSPILYVAASQPLAAYTRSLAAQGLIRPILLPSGRPAPLLHQHADDTTVHVRTRADARLVIDGPIQMFCRASGSQVQPSKSQGWRFARQRVGTPFLACAPSLGSLLSRAPSLSCIWGCCWAVIQRQTLQLLKKAVTEVLHDLLCGLALSTVRHDLPKKKKKKKKRQTRRPPTPHSSNA